MSRLNTSVGQPSIVTAIAVLAASNVVCAQIACEYEITAIIQAPECPPFGFPPTIGTGISEPIDGGLPNVVGYYNSCTIGPSRAFLWIGNENKFITIPMPDGTLASAAADIDGTRIVGTFSLDGDGLGGLGFLYDFQTDEFTNLGTLRGGTRSEAFAVNASGQIAGYWGNHIIGPWQTFMWEDGVMTDLGPSIGGANNRGFDINEAGAITGWAGTGNVIDSHAFIWENGKVTELPFIPDGFTSEGCAINSRGDVAGLGRMFDKDANEDVRRAFAWMDGEMIVLGTLPGFPDSFGTDINDDRTVVGYSQTNTQRAFVWTNGVMTALNDLVPPKLGLNIKVALAINQTGQIIAFGTDADSLSWILTPNEPPVGDLDGDCTVGASDLLILLAGWGPCKGCPSDLDGNGVVVASDLLILLANWG